MQGEGAVLAFIAWMWAGLWFFLGMWAMGAIWQCVIIDQGRAHYTVDPQTGKTELVWSK